MPTPTQDDRVHASAYGCITVPFLVIACIPLAWGARASWMNGQLARDGVQVSGRVVELRYVAANSGVVEQSRRGGNAGGVSPVVTFTTRAGEARTAIGSVNRRPAPWAVGDTVDVVYDAANPARADLRTEIDGWRLWFGIWCLVAAVPLIIASLPMVLAMHYRRRRGRPRLEG